jgi:uncharacterized membrane protein
VKRLTWVSLTAALVLIALFPLAFGQLMAGALFKLHLTGRTAVALVAAIVIGGFINIPIRRIPSEGATSHPLAAFGLADFWPSLQRTRADRVIAVNVGGCVVPASLAIYELARLAGLGSRPLIAAIAAAGVNVAVCYLLARPVPRLGIVMPGLFPPVVASLCAVALAPDWAPPVAFVAGVAGPLIGADLLHLKDVEKISTGVASIGGAGTFDGIVLSGIVAAYLS